MKRIFIIGSLHAGKTALASQLAERLGVPHIELDIFYWDSDGKRSDSALFVERTRRAVEDSAWVVDGNHDAVRPLLLTRADTIIWLDFMDSVMLLRLPFQGRNPIRALKENARLRRDFDPLFRAAATGHQETNATLVRLQSPGELHDWLHSMSFARNSGTLALVA